MRYLILLILFYSTTSFADMVMLDECEACEQDQWVFVDVKTDLPHGFFKIEEKSIQILNPDDTQMYTLENSSYLSDKKYLPFKHEGTEYYKTERLFKKQICTLPSEGCPKHNAKKNDGLNWNCTPDPKFFNCGGNTCDEYQERTTYFISSQNEKFNALYKDAVERLFLIDGRIHKISFKVDYKEDLDCTKTCEKMRKPEKK